MYNGNQYQYNYQQPNYYGNNGALPDQLQQMRMQRPMVAQQIPAQMPQQQAKQQSNGLIWVQGEAGAKSFIVAPGQTVMLMDSEGDRFYLKTADASGMPMPLRVFEYKERTDAVNQANNSPVSVPAQSVDEFVTREEFERRMAEMAAGCKCRAKAKEKAVNGGNEDGE